MLQNSKNISTSRLRSYLKVEPPIYVPGTALPAVWQLTNVSDRCIHLFRDWFDATSFRELPDHPLSGFSLEIMRSNGELVPDFVQVSGAMGDSGPLRLVHLYRLDPGKTYEVTIDAFHFTVCEPDTPFLWNSHQFQYLNPRIGEVLRIRALYSNSITSPSLGLDIWTGNIDSNIVEVEVLNK